MEAGISEVLVSESRCEVAIADHVDARHRKLKVSQALISYVDQHPAASSRPICPDLLAKKCAGEAASKLLRGD